LPSDLASIFGNADEIDIKVLAALLMLCDGEGIVTPADACDAIGIEKAELTASLKFWRGAGIIENTTESVQAKKAEAEEKSKSEEESKPEIKSAHRNGVVAQSSASSAYTSGEIADIIERRIVSAQFIDEAQRTMDKMFTYRDTEIVVGLVDRLGFDEEAALMILSYVASKGKKKTLRYAETMAIAFYDEGITETAAVMERINRMERAGETVSEIKKLYGIGDRALTASEKRMFTAWTETYGYGIDVITMAYDITVDNTQKPVPKYTNAILERWYAEGLKTADEVRRYMDRQSSEKTGVGKSYDAEEFFNAAIARGFEDVD
jgi:DnaD/phage-associated family protein